MVARLYFRVWKDKNRTELMCYCKCEYDPLEETDILQLVEKELKVSASQLERIFKEEYANR